MPPIDFRKKFKEIYQAKMNPSLIELPEIRYATVQSYGATDIRNLAYHDANAVIYAVMYNLKTAARSDSNPEKYDFTMPPLELFRCVDKETLIWRIAMRLPEFVTEDDFELAKAAAAGKKKSATDSLKIMSLTEGRCVQCMHIGLYANETDTVNKITRFLSEQGLETDVSLDRFRHDIYLSDSKKISPDKQKVIVRFPIRDIDFSETASRELYI